MINKESSTGNNKKPVIFEMLRLLAEGDESDKNIIMWLTFSASLCLKGQLCQLNRDMY